MKTFVLRNDVPMKKTSQSAKLILVPALIFGILMVHALLVRASGVAAPLVITTTSLPAATQLQPYTSPAMTAAGGVPPYMWSVTTADATLPEGMAINSSTGIISSVSVG